MHKPNTVFHIAAEPRIKICEDKPIETFINNVNGTLNVLDGCIRYGVKRMVFASSSSVYGYPKVDFVPEYEERIPITNYAVHKLIGEELCKLYWKKHSLETVILRFFNIYGPYQSKDSQYSALVSKTISKCLDYEQPEIYGDGEQKRDFIYVKDVIRALVMAGSTQNKDCFGECFNIGTAISTSVNHIVNEIQIQTDTTELEPKFLPKITEVRDIRADIDKSKKLLGWEPFVDVNSGLKRTIEFFVQK